MSMTLQEVRILFDDGPGPTAGRFVDVLNVKGEGINVGEWHKRKDGYWELRIPDVLISDTRWQPISILPGSDDLVWLWDSRDDSVEGPRAPNIDDPDCFTHWSPCEAPLK